ncbi:MAG: alginate lyase family protein [Phycisphaerales bacterium]|nr:alginate lyase family protein [Phycisphaerales bacterium]MCB9854182.1 alginate lyase family protein [Phycisphaerales bacterium]
MNPWTVLKTIRTLGPSVAFKRIVNAVKIKSGYIEWLDRAAPFDVEHLAVHLSKRLAPSDLLAAFNDNRKPFLFDLSDVQRAGDVLSGVVTPAAKAELLQRVERLKTGSVRYFSRNDYNLGRPINWHLNPQSGIQWPADRHWRHYSQFNPELGDMKLAWEANRFAFAYDLVRAYGLTADVSWVLLGLDLIDEWIDGNPAGLGVQWNCGQETAFRLMAWCFLLHAAVDAGVIDAARFARVLASIYRQTRRIERFISFSRSIRNNHSLSEALGLATIGMLFPQFDRAAIWRNKGLSIFQGEAAYQIFDDGAYIQQSMNYHRLMLSDCLWTSRLADLHGLKMSPEFLGRAARATEFLLQTMDFESGGVPNYGNNDGAQILPLTSCDYRDYRPIAQAASRQFKGYCVLPQGAQDEILFWVFGDTGESVQRKREERRSASFDVGGYYTLRGTSTWGMVRCHSYVERPAQADMLHFDLWRDGENVLRDSGSYSYYSKAPWQDHFKSTAAHNTIVVGGESQMRKGPRFMWYDWTRSRFIGRGEMAEESGDWWEGEHDGYLGRFGVIHRRRIERRGSDSWTVIDSLLGEGDVTATLRWHLIDLAYAFDATTCTLTMGLAKSDLALSIIAEDGTIASASVLRGASDEVSADGWESVYYGEKAPIPVLRVDLIGTMPLKVKTEIRFANKEPNG